ncbi:MAG: primosomal protein N' [Armatimonadota bacterium]|nr:primosomal protein N' [Armatimonadota bacterium]MCX7778109.1 primosomal protein N' [Armatimonadota bacterium]MDW8026170.1 primosomal protein N' [Armatimonadota bacterium]
MARYAQVSVDTQAVAIDKPLIYAIPDELKGKVFIGTPVLVPVKSNWVTGYVVGLSDEADLPLEAIKPVAKVLWNQPLFDEGLLKLARWISQYYHCALFDAVRLIVPPGWQQSVEERVWVEDLDSAERLMRESKRSSRRAELLKRLIDAGEPVKLSELRGEFGPSIRQALKQLCKMGVVKVSCAERTRMPSMVKRQAAKITEKGLSALNATETRLTEKHCSLLKRLREAPMPVTVSQLEDEGFTRHTIEALAVRGFVEIVEVVVPRVGELGPEGFEISPEGMILTDEQKAAIDEISACVDSGKFNVIVLHGVTASGKTEVYLRAIQRVIEFDGQALLLVPEIALTAQAAAIFRYRLGERVAILHSALSTGARFEEWMRILNDEVDVVIGPRSAIFAPLKRLRLIIVDEEQDESYKQDMMPKYNARDVALVRAKWHNAVVVLGSATPSVETYYRALTGKYKLVQLRKRVEDRPLPVVHIIDMRKASLKRSRWLSDILIDAIEKRLRDGEQVILFLNRRGYAPFVICTDCGFVETCPNCAVSLTLHRYNNILLCHHCNYSVSAPARCRTCGSETVAMTGAGTERIESEVMALFADAKVLRMDRDTTQRRGAHSAILSAFRKGEANILVGTQMVTKGLDFPNVTLVGVLNADVGLNFPDYRASERVFQLLSQVSGRAGRGERPGEVYIQTYNPQHYAIVASAKHSYESFFKRELIQRREPPYPPFTHLIDVVGSDENEGKAYEATKAAMDAVRAAIIDKGGKVTLLGPAPCLVSKLRGEYRFHFLMRSQSRADLMRVMSAALERMGSELKSKLSIDVDPMTIY